MGLLCFRFLNFIEKQKLGAGRQNIENHHYETKSCIDQNETKVIPVKIT